MRIFLATFGSLGDIRPFIWMGKNLQAQGHEIHFIANPHLQTTVEAAGLVFCPAGTEDDYQEAARPAGMSGNRVRDQGKQIAAARRLFTRMFVSPIKETCEIISASATPDMMVIGHNFAYGARLAAEMHALPFLNVLLSTYWLQAFRQPANQREVWTKKITAMATSFIDAQLFTKPFNVLRKELGLKPLQISSSRYMQGNMNLCLFPDWWLDFPLEPGMRTITIGFPVSSSGEVADEPLPANLLDFLQRHQAPLVFTPGSAVQDSKAFFAAAMDALRQLNRPGVFLTRETSARPTALPESVIACDFVPLAPLLRRSACLVYHGGIGTATQALLAGVPHLVCHGLAEQKENARQLIRLGIGQALPYREITGTAMADRLRRLLDQEKVQAACSDIRDRLMAKNIERPAATALATAIDRTR